MSESASITSDVIIKPEQAMRRYQACSSLAATCAFLPVLCIGLGDISIF